MKNFLITLSRYVEQEMPSGGLNLAEVGIVKHEIQAIDMETALEMAEEMFGNLLDKKYGLLVSFNDKGL